MLSPQLHQEGRRGPGVAVALQFHPLHLSRLQAHRRTVADLLPIPRAGRLHQSRVPFQHPLAPQFGVRTECASSAKNILAPVRWASSHSAAYSATKASRLASLALTRRFLGRLKANPNRCRQFRQQLRLNLMPNRSETNCRTPFQYQLANSMPTIAGGCCTAPFNSPCCASPRAGGTPGLLEYQGRRSAPAEGRQPPAYGMRVPLQGPCAGRGGPALGQEPEGVPTLLPLPGRGRQDHPPMQVPRVHLPLLEEPVYISHAHHTYPALTPGQANPVAPNRRRRLLPVACAHVRPQHDRGPKRHGDRSDLARPPSITTTV